MSDYPTTAVPFDDMPLPDLRDPVLAGPGSGAVTDAAESYRQLGDLLKSAAEDLRVAMTRARDAHGGAAAELAEQHLNRVAAVGELGAGQAQITSAALYDGAGYYARVRDDMNALPPIEEADSLREANRVQRDIDASKEIAVDAAQRYERNANWALGRQFPIYEAPTVEPPATSVAVAGGGPSGVGTAGAGGAPPGGTALAGSGVGGTAGGGVVGGAPAIGGPGGAGGPNGVLPVPVAGGPVGGGGSTSGVSGTGGGTGSPGSGGPGSGAPGSGAPGSGGPGSGGPGAGGPGAPVPSGTRPSGPGRGRPTAGSPAPLGPATEDPDLGRYPGADGRAGGGRPDAAVPPSSGWQPGQPWSSRTPPDPAGTGGYAGTGAYGGSGPSGGRAVGDPYAAPGGRPPGTPAPGVAPGGAAPGSGPIRGTAGSGVPFFPGAGGAGGGGDGTHPRPPWLVEDDPQAFWFAGMPEHGPGVIGGEGDCDH